MTSDDSDSNSTIGDFHSRALSSFYNQLLLLHSNNNVGTNAGKISYSNDVTNAQRQLLEGAEVESFAQYLVEDDTPKIDSAVKAYLSLVVARSAVQSEIDVISTSPLSSLLVSSSSREVAAGAADGVTTNEEEGRRQCSCTFAGNGDANRCALVCARTLLSTINSTILPSLESDVSSKGDNDDTYADNVAKRKMKQQRKLQSDTTRIIWNKLARKASSSSSTSGDKLANTNNVVSITMKPSKVLGRQSLLVAYPYIQERFRRGITLTDAKNVISATKTIPSSLDNDSTTDDDKIITASITIAADTITNTPFHLPLQSLSNETLPPVLPPKGIDVDKWKAFYTEFGQLLLIASSSSSSSSTRNSAVVMGEEGRPNDSALLWAKDGGAAELQSRRESRTRRAAEALSGNGRAGAG